MAGCHGLKAVEEVTSSAAGADSSLRLANIPHQVLIDLLSEVSEILHKSAGYIGARLRNHATDMIPIILEQNTILK